MLLVRIICSDPGCEGEQEVAVSKLDELDGFVCDCGHGFVVATVSDMRELSAEVISFAPRRADAVAERRAA